MKFHYYRTEFRVCRMLVGEDAQLNLTADSDSSWVLCTSWNEEVNNTETWNWKWKEGKKRRRSRENCSFVVRKRSKFLLNDDMSIVKDSKSVRNKFYFPLTILDKLGGGRGWNTIVLNFYLVSERASRVNLKVALFFFVPFLLLFPTSFSPRRCCARDCWTRLTLPCSWHCEFVTFARHRHYCRVWGLCSLSNALFPSLLTLDWKLDFLKALEHCHEILSNDWA